MQGYDLPIERGAHLEYGGAIHIECGAHLVPLVRGPLDRLGVTDDYSLSSEARKARKASLRGLSMMDASPRSTTTPPAINTI